jgi:hypothetical protein
MLNDVRGYDHIKNPGSEREFRSTRATVAGESPRPCQSECGRLWLYPNHFAERDVGLDIPPRSAPEIENLE